MNNLRKMTQSTQTPQEQLKKKYSSAVSNLLVVILFTVVNIVLLFTKSYTYFLFSAYIPYSLTDLGMYLCGKYPQEVYGADYADMVFFNDWFLITTIVVAAVILVLYLLSWIFARKGKIGWLIFALVFFSVDFLALIVLNGISLDMLIDLAFHVWVIVILGGGIKAYYKLKTLPAEDSLETDGVLNADEVLNAENSVPTETID